MMKPVTRILAWSLAASLSYGGFVQSAQAGVIGAEQLAAPAASVEAQAARDTVLRAFERADLQAALQERGVDMSQARARVDALTDAEALSLAERIDAAPAGGSDILGALLFIFVLLLVTDILGLTKIFPFTRSVR